MSIVIEAVIGLLVAGLIYFLIGLVPDNFGPFKKAAQVILVFGVLIWLIITVAKFFHW